MNKLLTASLPALALLALGGCTASRSVATTEDDGVYYSSQDRTTAVAAPRVLASQSVTTDNSTGSEATNPDYQAGTDTRRQAPNNPEYYDDGYANSSSSYNNNSRFRTPYAGPNVGLAYYSPPVVFAPAYGYGGNYGFSSYAGICDPFYSPWCASPLYGYSPYDAFYSPFGYGYGGSLISISFGSGGYRGYSYGYGRPYYGGGGYGGYYDPYYGGGSYGGSSYGYGGYNSYGNYYGNRQVIRPGGTSVGVGSPVLVGPRRGRGGDVLAGRGNVIANPSTTPANAPSGGRRHFDGGGTNSPMTVPASGVVAAPATSSAGAVNGNVNGNNAAYGGGRRPGSNAGYQAPNSPTAITTDQATSNGGGRRGGFDNVAPTGAEPNTSGNQRGQWRTIDQGNATRNTAGTAPDAGRGYEQPQPQGQPEARPSERQGRRGGFFGTAPDNSGQSQAGTNNNRGYEQPAQQPQPQRTYEQPRRTYEQPQQPQPQRTYEQPRRAYEQPQQPQPQRTYEQPRRTYEQPASQPQRSYERPSYSQPSYGGGNNSGGGGGRRGGRF